MEIFKVGEIRKLMKKQSLLKKPFDFLKRHLYQNGRAESMPIVASRLVIVPLYFAREKTFLRENGCSFCSISG